MAMKETITIKHVGPIDNIEMVELRPLTVLIGSSASGKSTIMKIVVLMRYIFKMINIRSYLKNSNISKSLFRFRFDSMLHEGLKEMVKSDSVIIYSVECNGHTYTVTYRNKKLDANFVIEKEDLSFFKESFISETRNMIPTWSSKVSSNKGAQLGFYFHETFSDFEQATDIVKTMDLGFLGLRMQVKRVNNIKRYILDSAEESIRPFELLYASSGLQTATPLLSLLHYFAHDFSFKDAFQRSVLTYLFEQDRLLDYKPAIERSEIDNVVHVHIEEPELSLDPESQRLLLSAMIRQAFHHNNTDRRIGLMIATHSPYIVNQLNVFLQASYTDDGRKAYPYVTEDEIAVYHLSDGALQPLVAIDNRTRRKVINTMDLSAPMTDIYKQYINIK